jgi:putative ABC transport system permease protein
VRLSTTALLGALELGLVYALVAQGVFLSFRVLSFPDLTVDGSFPLGAAVTASLIVAGFDPFLATACAMVAGAAAGLVTAWLNVRFNILHLLASILVMIALYSVNIRIMGRPNVALLGKLTVLTPFEGLGLPDAWLRPLVVAIFVALVTALLGRFLLSETGLAMRATGANPRMARANGIATGALTLLGMAISNAIVALAGSLFAQTNGFADVTTGLGTIVVGLAAVILGETLVRARRMAGLLVACILGSVLYRLAIAAALDLDILGIQASDLNLVTAVLVCLALLLPQVRPSLGSLARRVRP